jgi:hypothetical protein
MASAKRNGRGREPKSVPAMKVSPELWPGGTSSKVSIENTRAAHPRNDSPDLVPIYEACASASSGPRKAAITFGIWRTTSGVPSAITSP